MYPSSCRLAEAARRRRAPSSARLAAAARTDGEPSAETTSRRTSSVRSTTASASHWEATAASRPSPVARSMPWSTPCTARPTAVPYRPFNQGGRSRSRGRFCRPGSGGSSSTSGSPSSVREVADTVVGRRACASAGVSSALHSSWGRRGAGGVMRR